MIWPINTAVSTVTGKLLGTVDEMYQFLDFMTGDKLFTHQLPRAEKVCRQFLVEQFNWLAEIKPESINTENWKDVLFEIVSNHGAELDIQPLPPGVWIHKDPLAELLEIQQAAAIKEITER